MIKVNNFVICAVCKKKTFRWLEDEFRFKICPECVNNSLNGTVKNES